MSGRQREGAVSEISAPKENEPERVVDELLVTTTYDDADRVRSVEPAKDWS